MRCTNKTCATTRSAAINLRLRKRIRKLTSQASPEDVAACFNNAVFIVSAPRAGSTLLFSLLSQSPEIWTIGGESHGIYAQFPQLAAEDKEFSSGRLFDSHADTKTREHFLRFYLALVKKNNGETLIDDMPHSLRQRVVFLEKTPRNSLNIDFLRAVFPSARFIYLHRDPRENISSIIEGWRLGAKSGEFVTFRKLPDWPLGYWCFLLPPGWHGMSGRPISDIAAFQWQACNEIILQDLSNLPADHWTSVSYSDLVSQPADELLRLCEFCGAEGGGYLSSRSTGNLPLSASTITPPRKDKWKRHETEIQAVMPGLKQTMKLIDEAHKQKGAGL